MKTLICDRCKKVMGKGEFKIRNGIKLIFIHSNGWRKFFDVAREIELCDECLNELEKFIGIGNENLN